MIADICHLDRRIAAVEVRIKSVIAESKISLVGLLGVGPVLAAKPLGKIGDIHGSNQAHFAANTRYPRPGGLQWPGRPPSAVPGR